MHPTFIDHTANIIEITRGNDDTDYWIFFVMRHPENSILWHFDSADERDRIFTCLRERLGVERI